MRLTKERNNKSVYSEAMEMRTNKNKKKQKTQESYDTYLFVTPYFMYCERCGAVFFSGDEVFEEYHAKSCGGAIKPHLMYEEGKEPNSFWSMMLKGAE